MKPPRETSPDPIHLPGQDDLPTIPSRSARLVLLIGVSFSLACLAYTVAKLIQILKP